ncbi:MAG: glycogen/starch synthase [Bacteroidota bacterium]
MKVLHISAECYPAAKAGGLGDVAGALPKYLTEAECPAAVIIPKYHTKWILQQEWETQYEGSLHLHHEYIAFSIQKLKVDTLGFPLYVADLPGKYDRPSVYLDANGKGFWDEVERSLAFQQATLHWVNQFDKLPEVLHCHDHHTGLVPFMVKCCPIYNRLSSLPTVFTIHNGEYHGTFGWEKVNLLPLFDGRMGGLIDWNEAINPLAAAIKCSWRVTTVSPTYMKELRYHSGHLSPLLQQETGKSSGILNGIDTEVWNPKTDALIAEHLKRSFKTFKQKNRAALKDKFTIQDELPLITFIGRLAGEKGAHLLAPMIAQFLNNGGQATFIVLGTGEPNLHHQLKQLERDYPEHVNVALEYNEKLAHQLYAGSDFLVMPSKVEPCGLNQMYAMRYGTIPIARAVGGLKDTVIDFGQPNGRGVQFTLLEVDDASYALHRATRLFQDIDQFEQVRKTITKVDFSWENSAQQYIDLYDSIIE